MSVKGVPCIHSIQWITCITYFFCHCDVLYTPFHFNIFIVVSKMSQIFYEYFCCFIDALAHLQNDDETKFITINRPRVSFTLFIWNIFREIQQPLYSLWVLNQEKAQYIKSIFRYGKPSYFDNMDHILARRSIYIDTLPGSWNLSMWETRPSYPEVECFQFCLSLNNMFILKHKSTPALMTCFNFPALNVGVKVDLTRFQSSSSKDINILRKTSSSVLLGKMAWNIKKYLSAGIPKWS